MVRRRFITDGEQLELFTIFPSSSDIRSKQVRDLMTWGMFNISNHHKHRLRHEQGEMFVDVAATNGKGIATYHDNDILIFLTSHLVQAMNEGKDVSSRIFFTAHEFFRFSRREHISGTRYDQIWNALWRLQDTFVHTNINIVGGNEIESRWNWLSEIHRIKSSRTGKSLGFQVVLADPLYKSIVQDKPRVLTLDNDYFTLRSGFLKWLYLYARKSAGTDPDNEWLATERMLHSRCGSSLHLTQFRKMLKHAVDQGSLLDYDLKHAMLGRERAVAFHRKKFLPRATHRTTIVKE